MLCRVSSSRCISARSRPASAASAPPSSRSCSTMAGYAPAHVVEEARRPVFGAFAAFRPLGAARLLLLGERAAQELSSRFLWRSSLTAALASSADVTLTETDGPLDLHEAHGCQLHVVRSRSRPFVRRILWRMSDAVESSGEPRAATHCNPTVKTRASLGHIASGRKLAPGRDEAWPTGKGRSPDLEATLRCGGWPRCRRRQTRTASDGCSPSPKGPPRRAFRRHSPERKQWRCHEEPVSRRGDGRRALGGYIVRQHWVDHR